MTLSAQEYQRRLKQMTLYIEQEAYEKAEEINVKAEEAYKKEKDQLLHSARGQINQEYEIRESEVLQKVKINISNGILQQKLHILNEKMNHIQSLRQEIQQRITQDMKNTEHRSKTLYLLIMEGLYKVMEKNVKIRCKQSDTNIITSILPSLQAEYQQTTNQTVLLTLDSQFISNTELGGIYLLASNDRILVENTLDLRVDQIIRRFVPVLNKIWFNLPKHSFVLCPERKHTNYLLGYDNIDNCQTKKESGSLH